MNNQSLFTIWIVIIIAVILTGGIFAWQYFRASEEGAKTPGIKLPEETSADKTTGWMSYKNSKLGYEIKYPPNFYFYEISLGNISGTASESISFQEKERWKDSWEWPRFEVEIFINDNLSLLSWLQERWLEYDTPIGIEPFKKNFEQIIKQRQEITANNYQAIKLPHSYDKSVYFLFVSNNGSSIAKLSCVSCLEDISEICDIAFATFRFSK